MSGYAWAWLVMAGCVAVGLFALYRATRGGPLPGARRVLGWLLAVWALLPAPVPGYSDHYAPAFLVFAFEWLFQRPGEPRTAGLILAAGTALAVALAVLWGTVMGRRRAEAPEGPEGPDRGREPPAS